MQQYKLRKHTACTCNAALCIVFILLRLALLADDIYRDDVVFKDPRNTVRGKKNYQRIFKVWTSTACSPLCKASGHSRHTARFIMVSESTASCDGS